MPDEYSEQFLKSLKPYKTGIGLILDAIGWPRERVKEVLSNPNRVQEIGEKLGMYVPPYQRNELSGVIGNALTNMIPYESSVENALIGQIGPVYHGSPYKFSKFENKAIGTGEGAQAFGYGHYLTENPEVATHYKNAGQGLFQYSIKGKPVPIGTAGHMAMDTATDMNMLLGYKKLGSQGTEMSDYVQDIIEERIARYKRNPSSPGSPAGQDMENLIKYYEENVRNAKPDSIIRHEGNIYEATINKGKPSSADVFLEWDKPLDEKQLNTIKDFMAKEFPKVETVFNQIQQYESLPITGGYAYNYLSRVLGGDKGASEFFNRMGFSGIKYPTGTLSGIKGSEKYNYVIFNPEDITIESVR